MSGISDEFISKYDVVMQTNVVLHCPRMTFCFSQLGELHEAEDTLEAVLLFKAGVFTNATQEQILAG